MTTLSSLPWDHVTTTQIRLILTFSAQPLSKIGQGLPLGGIHVHVLPVADILIVNNVVVDSLSA